MPEMVVVGISNGKNRLRDLTTSTIKTQYGMPFNDKNGKAENFIPETYTAPFQIHQLWMV